MKQVFLNDREDCAWLREAHCPDAPEFRSFTLEGNEDSPDRVILYGDVCPTIFDNPVDVYVPNLRGVLVGRVAGSKRTWAAQHFPSQS